MTASRKALPSDLVNEYGYTIGAASTPILNVSRARRAVILTNGGTTTISIGLSSEDAAGKGIIINPGVDPLILCRDEFAPYVCSQLYAISSAAGGILGVVEIVDQN
ncbi:MAG: hypothetical protein KGL39_57450 [Patescibacteria group bacterium]|nr:hypothetical protein [Patescibacteria group bacterium]